MSSYSVVDGIHEVFLLFSHLIWKSPLKSWRVIDTRRVSGELIPWTRLHEIASPERVTRRKQIRARLARAAVDGMAFRAKEFLLIVEEFHPTRGIPFARQGKLAISLRLGRLGRSRKLQAALNSEERRKNEKGADLGVQWAGSSISRSRPVQRHR